MTDLSIMRIPVQQITFTKPQTTMNGNRTIYTRGPDNREVQGSLTKGLTDVISVPFGAKTYQNEHKTRMDCQMNITNPDLQAWLLEFQNHLIASAKKHKDTWFKPKHKMTDERIEDNFSPFYNPNNINSSTGAQYPPSLKSKLDTAEGYKPCAVYHSDFQVIDGKKPTMYPGTVSMIKPRSKILVNGKFGGIWQSPSGRNVMWGITFNLTHVCIVTEPSAETQPFDLGDMEVIVSTNNKRPLSALTASPPPLSPRKKKSTGSVSLSASNSINNVANKSVLLD